MSRSDQGTAAMLSQSRSFVRCTAAAGMHAARPRSIDRYQCVCARAAARLFLQGLRLRVRGPYIVEACRAGGGGGLAGRPG
jgi:hypothetical protein